MVDVYMRETGSTVVDGIKSSNVVDISHPIAKDWLNKQAVGHESHLKFSPVRDQSTKKMDRKPSPPKAVKSINFGTGEPSSPQFKGIKVVPVSGTGCMITVKPDPNNFAILDGLTDT